MAPLIAVLALDVTVRLYWQQGGPEAKTIKLPLEEYVAAVLGGEASVMKSPEALKAMAIAARTYAVRFRGRHSREGFDFCDTTHCQDYRRAGMNEATNAAVEATEGELIWYRGALAATYYSANCGGMSEVSSEGPYLNQHRDPWCLRSPDPWRTTLTRDEVKRALSTTGLAVPPMFTQVSVTGRTPSNRVTRVNIGGAEVDGPMFRQAIGRTIGWDRLPSGWFDILSFNDRFVIAGRGRGHGIGLCQTGCDLMGDDGKSFREILEFYYRGTKVALTAAGFNWKYAGGERVDVFAAQPDSAFVATADQALRDAESRSGIRMTARPQIRIYPSVTAFRDATGQPGGVAAIARGSTIRMQPRASASTVRHEMLHVVLATASAPDQPWWFQEGLALSLNDERPTDPRYRDAADRVNALIARNGRDVVLGWWRQGLPQKNPDPIQRRPSQSKAKKNAR